MEFYGHHGVTAAEKEKGGNYEVDCEIEADITRCAASDDIEDAIDYDALYLIIRGHMENRRYNLMETLAENLKDEIKRKTGAKRIILRVRKMGPPIEGPMDFFEVETSG
jgi:dihydroneopterin aldolase